MARSGKNAWALFFLILAGVVLGGFLGYLAKDVPFLSWLNYGQEFGIGKAEGSNLLNINMGIITVAFGMNIKITIAGIIGIFAAVLIYKRL